MAEFITLTDLKTALWDDPGIQLLDVRRETDFQAGPAPIPKALRADPEQIESWQKDLDRSALTVVYCVRGGPVSQSAADTLAHKGFKVAYLEGGLAAWEDGC